MNRYSVMTPFPPLISKSSQLEGRKMPGQYYCFVPFTAGEADQHLSEEKSVVTIAKTWKKDADEFLVAARKRPIIIQYDPATANLLAGDFKALEDTIYIIG